MGSSCNCGAMLARPRDAPSASPAGSSRPVGQFIASCYQDAVVGSLASRRILRTALLDGRLIPRREHPMIIHGSSLSPFVRKTLAYVAEKGLKVDLKPIGLANTDPDFVACSPFRKMPAFRDDDFAISDLKRHHHLSRRSSPSRCWSQRGEEPCSNYLVRGVCRHHLGGVPWQDVLQPHRCTPLSRP